MARSMLLAKGLPNKFWGQAVATAVNLLNLSPTRAVMNQTPFEAWRGKKPRLRHLRIFGCTAYALIPSNLRHKLDRKSEKYIFVGYNIESKAYKLYNPTNGKVIVSRDVRFNEEESWGWNGDEQHTQAGVLPNEPKPEPPTADMGQNSSTSSSSSDSKPPNSPQHNSGQTTPHSSSTSTPGTPSSSSSSSDSPTHYRAL
ncbi:hypothetical protein vseg_010437 [Gypsophila vaccaria]